MVISGPDDHYYYNSHNNHNNDRQLLLPTNPQLNTNKPGHTASYFAPSVNSRDIEAYAVVPRGSSLPPPPSSSSQASGGGGGGNPKFRKRVHDNHSGPVIRPTEPDFIATRLALLTTIDGDLHCIDKANGEIVWTKPPEATGAIVSSNITKYTRSPARSTQSSGVDGGGLFGGTEGGRDGVSGGQLDDSDSGSYSSEDWTFIVEPSEIPRLYVYSNTSGLQPVGSLVHLVSNSPQIRPDGKRITGGKKTSLLELEISTGRKVSEFEAEGGCTGPEAIKGSGVKTIVLGHAEYTLCIADRNSGMQWDISYSEYFPVTDGPGVIERSGPMTWIGSNKDGMVALWNSAAGIMWRTRLNSPTTSVFEVFMNSKTRSAVLTRQKKLPGMEQLAQRAHVGMYQDQLYVLSQQNYPLLGKTELDRAGWPYLGIDGQDPEDDERDGSQRDGDEGGGNRHVFRTDCRAGALHYPGCMVGPHMIGFPFQPEGGFLTVGDGSNLETGNSHSSDKAVQGHEGNNGSAPGSGSRNRGNTYDPFAPPPPISTTTTVVGWFVVLVGILTAIVYSKGIMYLIKPVDSFLEEHSIQFRIGGVAQAVTQGVVGVSSAVLTASSFKFGGTDRSGGGDGDSLPEYNKSTMIRLSAEMRRSIHGESATLDGKSDGQMEELNEKVDGKGGNSHGKRGGPRSNKAQQGTDQENVNGEGKANGGGGRKKKRGAGGKGQKAAAAAAAAAAVAAGTTTNGGSVDGEKAAKTASDVGRADGSSSGSLTAVSTGEHTAETHTAASSNSSSQDGEAMSVLQRSELMLTRLPSNNTPLLKSIQVTDMILGYGSHGTVVYKGTYDGRAVAVKRLLIDFYDVAFHEVKLLQESDDHPNVVRYFRSEQCDRFLYIALELCSASLDDIIERGHQQPFRDLSATLEPQRILYQIISGIHHLHSLKIVHRDIKPQNILIGEPKQRPKPSRSAQLSSSSLSTLSPTPPPLGSSGMITSVVRANTSPALDLCPGRVLISDFGLCRKLENDQSSFHNTTMHGGRGAGGGGTIGWRAPECFSGQDDQDEELWQMVNGQVGTSNNHSNADDSSSLSSSSGGAGVGGMSTGRANRMTRAIDIFSAGCVFYYVLTNGEHPFGDRYSRERNILLGRPNLDGLDLMGQEGVEAKDLISKMIAHNPADRPDAFTVMHHPFFWSANKRLMFMQDCSDRFEIEDRNVDGTPLLDSQYHQSPLLMKLESNAKEILVKDWYKVIDRTLVENLGKYRKYDGNSVRDLLRALRNKKHHYQDLPPHVKRALGELPHGFLNYFTSRFPNLMLHLYYIVADDPQLRNESMFRHYFVD
ncbi:bifunctional endoribonuclease/protein kinase ire1 [Mortierella claussenii]|nr:bifunctional endoribonuclease/protein kinase ire1 [Mortierella claussenii]